MFRAVEKAMVSTSMRSRPGAPICFVVFFANIGVGGLLYRGLGLTSC